MGFSVNENNLKAVNSAAAYSFMKEHSQDIISKFEREKSAILRGLMSGLGAGVSWKDAAKNIGIALKTLNEISQTWCESNLPALYGMGWMHSAQALGLNPGPKAVFSVPHQQAMSLMVNNAESKFGEAVQTIGRRVDDIYRDVTIQAARDRLAGGAVPKGMQEAEARIVKDLKDNGITAFTDSAGRKWELETYANMALRTVSMEAYIQGSVNKYVDEGVDYVEVGGVEPVPGVSSEAAFEYYGKILCLSGQDTRFDSLATAEEAGLMHPNNWRDLLPLSAEEVEAMAEEQGVKPSEDVMIPGNEYHTSAMKMDNIFTPVNDTKIEELHMISGGTPTERAFTKLGKEELGAVLHNLPKDIDRRSNQEVKDYVTHRVAESMKGYLPERFTEDQIHEVYLALAQEETDNYSHYESAGKDADLLGITDLFVQEWATTSDSGDTVAIAMQEVAKEVFGIQGDFRHWTKDAPGEEFVGSATELRGRVDDFLAIPGMKDSMTAFLKGQYESTQMMFKEEGITEITLFRGFSMPDADITPIFGSSNGVGEASVRFQPMSSFSTDLTTARGFASPESSEDTSVMVSVRVPVDRILGSCASGYGCLGESEFVVLGAENNPDKVYFSTAKDGSSAMGNLAKMLSAMFKPDVLAQEVEAAKSKYSSMDFIALHDFIEKVSPDVASFMDSGTSSGADKFAYMKSFVKTSMAEWTQITTSTTASLAEKVAAQDKWIKANKLLGMIGS